MKKRILVVMICLMAGFTKVVAQTNCEDKWNQVIRVNTSDTWKETNTINSGF